MKQVKYFPIFLHIPKNAGTYTIDVIHKHVARLNKFSIHEDEHIAIPVKRLTIHTKSFTWSLIVKFLTNNHETDPNIRRHELSIKRNVHNPWVRSCDLSTLYYYIEKKYLQVYAGIVEPDNTLDCRSGMYEMLALAKTIKLTPKCYTCLREPFSRQQSLFHYLHSSVSKHEPTHGLIKCKTMNDYIMSEYMEDSWLVRSCTGAPLTTELNKCWYDNCVQFLTKHKFSVYATDNVSKMIEDITDTCWGTKPTDKDSHQAHVNEQQYKKIAFDELTVQQKKRFTNRMKWDYKLYKRFCNKVKT